MKKLVKAELEAKIRKQKFELKIWSFDPRNCMAWKQSWPRIHLHPQIESETEIEAKIKVEKISEEIQS